MSFSLTTAQIRDGSKTVTRRLGWAKLRPGDVVNACVKCMGLRPGESVERIRQLRIVSVRAEPLYRITSDRRYGRRECRREGFPEMDPSDFVAMFCQSMGCCPDIIVNRIEFEFLKETP